MMYMYMDPTICTSERYRVSVMYIYGSTHTWVHVHTMYDKCRLYVTQYYTCTISCIYLLLPCLIVHVQKQYTHKYSNIHVHVC
jgi:hypothetical protein